jgi:hypothetical protein
MFDGKLKGIVDKNLSNHPAWKSRLLITFGESEYLPWEFKNESESNIDVSLS